MHTNSMANILILNGPNLNMLGTREPNIYGKKTLLDLNTTLEKQAKELGHHIQTLQSNAEHELIGAIHNAKEQRVNFIIINAGAFSHTSLALRDAFLAVGIPFIKIHISNVYAREKIRKSSYLADIAVGVIGGFGTYSYELALLAADHYLRTH